MCPTIRWHRVHQRPGGSAEREGRQLVVCHETRRVTDTRECATCARFRRLEERDDERYVICQIPPKGQPWSLEEDAGDRVVSDTLPPAPSTSVDPFVPVSDVMDHRVETVLEETTVPQLARVVLAEDVAGFVIVDGRGHPLGTIGREDLLHRLEACEENHCFDKLGEIHAKDIMVPAPYALDVETPLTQAAAAMAQHHSRRIPVMDDSAVVGVLTAGGILAWLGRAGGYLVRPEQPELW